MENPTPTPAPIVPPGQGDSGLRPVADGRLDFRALVNPSFGLTPQILEAIGKRAARFALDPESNARTVGIHTRNVLKMLEMVRDRDEMESPTPVELHVSGTLTIEERKTLLHRTLAAIEARAGVQVNGNGHPTADPPG